MVIFILVSIPIAFLAGVLVRFEKRVRRLKAASRKARTLRERDRRLKVGDVLERGSVFTAPVHEKGHCVQRRSPCGEFLLEERQPQRRPPSKWT